ncbi:chemotaxis protein [Bdellovibrio sp. ZAP7]|uniref:methyl-accepting chemotaxis protein n=1 Tax=Bdellovibrio sp. ZAP7 TaxID=2231053 RepID=UPI0011572E93|nr:methyl-accepting chemotaxis protein [Bdellovibrio sp. ZAP7]QDK45076.1 chemotaxis protein [Bdellovibrio sp. ZAP7]
MNQTSLSSWFRGIKGKLLFAACLPMVGFAINYVISSSSMNSLGTLLNIANGDTIPNLTAVGEMRQARNKFGYQIFAALAMETEEKRHERIKLAREGIKEFKENMELYKNAPAAPELQETDKKAYAVLDEYLGLLDKVASLADSNKAEDHKQVQDLMDGRLWELGKIMHQMAGSAMKYYDKTAQANSAEAKSTIAKSSTIILMTTGVSCLAIFSILLFIAIRLSKSVGHVASSLSESSAQVASAVEQLNEAGNSLSQSSTEAAASLEETVAALEELTSMVQMNSDNAKQAAGLSATSRQNAEAGENDIKSLITAMTEISQSSRKIEEIISVIDDIAFQTNLLALNAAVEAARAGEQGKGFAVVAEAVRALAQRSASSAKDISSLIKDSVSQIENGSRIADESGAVLSNIVSSIKKVSDLNNEIAAASSEQTTGIQQISKAMNQLDQSSQSNAASAEEIAATSGEINNLATTTQNLTVELGQVIYGTSDIPAMTPTESPVKKSRAATTSKKVIPFKKPVTAMAPPKKSAPAPSTASDMIPFDEESDRKVGTTDGF